MRANRMLRSMRRGLETGSRCTLPGHEGGNSGYRQEFTLRVTAPVLDPTAESGRTGAFDPLLPDAVKTDERLYSSIADVPHRVAKSKSNYFL